MITIGQPYITENDKTARLNCEINIKGKIKNLYIECEKKYAPYLVYERADAFVVLLVKFAMRIKQDITSIAPITEELIHNINEFLLPTLIKTGNTIGMNLHNVKIISPLISSSLESSPKTEVVTCISCGCDSLYTLKHYIQDTPYEHLKPTHLYLGNCSIDVMDTQINDLNDFIRINKMKYDKCRRVSNMVDIPLLTTYSNFLTYSNKPTPNHYEIMSEIMCFRKLFKIFLLPSGYDYTAYSVVNGLTKSSAYYELLSAHVLTIPGFVLYNSGAGMSRLEKMRSIMDYDIAKQELETCFFSIDNKNCSKPTCSKCLRMLTALDIYGKLDDFKAVFNIQKYKDEHDKYMIEVYRRREEYFIVENYELLKNKYPNSFNNIS